MLVTIIMVGSAFLDRRRARQIEQDLNRMRADLGPHALDLDLAESAPDLGAQLDHDVAGDDAMGAGDGYPTKPGRRGRHIRK